MTKLLFIIAVTIALVLWFKHMGRPKRDLDAKKQHDVEDMVRCKVCGVNMPRSEALLAQGSFYCCEEHRRRDLG
ncbi:MAG: PP0621 family protein [Hydrogenophilaceae bacterium]